MADEFERELRDSLARHAADAPRGDMLAERIIHAADRSSAESPAGRSRRWRTWALPLVAAGAVAGVVAAIVGIQDYHPSASHSPAIGSPSQNASILQTEPTPASSPPPSRAATPPPSAADLNDVHILDLTFVGPDEGYALASADCVADPGNQCTALLHTVDGRTWQTLSHTPFNVRGVNHCADPCVSNIRFATSDIGYAFGPRAFFMTTDGGDSWVHPGGGAIALETLDHNVIRVTSPHTGCPSWCDVQVETSDIGSTTWEPSALGSTPGNGVELSRGGGHNAYLLFPGAVSGGAESATSVLYRSTDDGSTWAPVGEPCPQPGAEVDSSAVAGGAGDQVSVLCTTRQAAPRYRVTTSADVAGRFTQLGDDIPLDSVTLLAGDPKTVLVAAGNGMARSSDGGRTWRVVDDVGRGLIGFVGFESETVGRAVSADGRTIWTTRNGGQTWTAAQFG